jgi:hypothetical protein
MSTPRHRLLHAPAILQPWPQSGQANVSLPPRDPPPRHLGRWPRRLDISALGHHSCLGHLPLPLSMSISVWRLSLSAPGSSRMHAHLRRRRPCCKVISIPLSSDLCRVVACVELCCGLYTVACCRYRVELKTAYTKIIGFACGDGVSK